MNVPESTRIAQLDATLFSLSLEDQAKNGLRGYAKRRYRELVRINGGGKHFQPKAARRDRWLVDVSPN